MHNIGCFHCTFKVLILAEVAKTAVRKIHISSHTTIINTLLVQDFYFVYIPNKRKSDTINNQYNPVTERAVLLTSLVASSLFPRPFFNISGSAGWRAASSDCLQANGV